MKVNFGNSKINFLQKMLKLSIALLIGTVIWLNPFNIAQAKDPVTIRVPSWWFGEPANKDWLADVIEVFETKHPNIKVEGYNLPFGEYADTLLVEIAAGKPPDVVHLLNMNIGDFLTVSCKFFSAVKPEGSTVSDVVIDAEHGLVESVKQSN